MSNSASGQAKMPFSLNEVKPFLIRGLILFVGWKLLYLLVLKPSGIPNDWLTRVTTDGVAWLLSLFHGNVTEFNHTLYINGTETVTIAPECNGLELFVLYIGFLLCIPTSFMRVLLFSVTGVLVVFALNVLRSELLAVMYYNGSYFVDFAHHYAFKLIIYGVVFLGWVLYVRKPKSHEA